MAFIESSEAFVLSERIQCKDFTFSLPLDPINNLHAGNIRVFARAVRSYNARDPSSKEWTARPEPWIVYLQGGPGFECSPPARTGSGKDGFLIDKGYQVLLLDQRGTGLSSALSAEMLSKMSVEQLALYRADYIVRDCEAIRKLLIGGQKWSVLGQSFGGFCATAYLSTFPDSLREVFTTGGMPPIIKSTCELTSLYSTLYNQVLSRNRSYYTKYPTDVARVQSILSHLQTHPTTTPNGGNLSPRRFLSLGTAFGSHGGIDTIHFLVQRCASELENQGKLSPNSLNRIQEFSSFDYNPIYAVLHEACYYDEYKPDTPWASDAAIAQASALRSKSEDETENLAWELTDEGKPMWMGEMVREWMFDDFVELRACKTKMEEIGRYEGWNKLYDLDQLAKNEVPVYSAIYVEDMYVGFEHAVKTAKSIKGNKVFITNTMFHDALRSKTEEVLGALFRLADEIAD